MLISNLFHNESMSTVLFFVLAVSLGLNMKLIIKCFSQAPPEEEDFLDASVCRSGSPCKLHPLAGGA